jgi:hypothetical protein
MAAEQGGYVGIELRKRTWEMTIVTRTGKFRINERGTRRLGVRYGY